MDDQARRVKIQQFAEAISARDMEVFDALYHDDVVIHWPQSGEVIRGKKNIRELREAHPTPPTGTLRRIIGSGDLWAIEMDFDYDGDRFHVIVIHQYRDGLVESETSYYAAPFEAPAWRARWVADEPATKPAGIRRGGG
jgi:ketosteroid isomerase-like protein